MLEAMALVASPGPLRKLDRGDGKQDLAILTFNAVVVFLNSTP